MEYEPTDLFAVLADPTRLRCLTLLAKEPSLCVCHLVDAMQEPQPKLSKHLGVLREMGLVADERKAQWVHYSLKTDLPAWVRAALDAAFEGAKEQQPYADDAKRLKKRLSPACNKAA
ncbi:MAG: metalloregulator ArsR/SmtB family transcription factor [Alphaproteobacteria bacterium]|nr:metalloregulator ArsR/SmtB family transcription factor [Alphaproteobacteria bacterium]